jgi:hypothetical protein
LSVTLNLAVIDFERVKQEIASSTISDLDLMNSARLGNDHYDFNAKKKIKEGG